MDMSLKKTSYGNRKFILIGQDSDYNALPVKISGTPNGTIKAGQPFHFKFLFGMAISSIIGVYILRFALWNSFGKEIIELKPESITYTSDYRIYRDNKNHKRDGKLTFSYRPIGYIEDQMGCLTIHTGAEVIKSVVKMSIIDINSLIKELNTTNNL